MNKIGYNICQADSIFEIRDIGSIEGFLFHLFMKIFEKTMIY